MAQHKSAKKRIRRNARAAGVNHSRLSRIRTAVKELETAITAGDKTAAQAAFKKVTPELMRGATKGAAGAPWLAWAPARVPRARPSHNRADVFVAHVVPNQRSVAPESARKNGCTEPR